MPLINSSSDAARQENIKREIAAGKDPKQAVAIGYSVQRQAGSHPRNHALAKASATHLHRMGHIDQAKRDAIHAAADKALARPAAQPAGMMDSDSDDVMKRPPPPRKPFGSFAP